MFHPVSYWGGPAVGCVGVRGVLIIFGYTVMNLEEAVIRVISGRRGPSRLEGVAAQRVHGDLGRWKGVEALKAHRRGITGVGWLRRPGTGAATPLITVAIARNASDCRGLEVVRGPLRGPQLFVAVNEHVNSKHSHHFGNNEGKGPKVKRPAIRVAIFL